MQQSAVFKLRVNIMLLSLGILVLALGFNVLLSVSALDSLATESIISGYHSYGERLAYDIERGLRFGKPLHSYSGMDDMLGGLLNGVEGVNFVEVLNTEGSLLYSRYNTGYSKPSSEERQKRFFALKPDPDGRAVSQEHVEKTPTGYLIFIPLEHHGTAGWVALEVAKQQIKASVRSFLHWLFLLLAAACLIAGLILTGWLALFTSTRVHRSRLHSILGKLLIVVIGGTQLAYSCGTLVLFDSFVEQAMRTKAEILAQSAERDFEYLIQKDIDVVRLKGKKKVLEQLVADNAELQGAELLAPDGSSIAAVGSRAPDNLVVEADLDVYWPSRFQQRMQIMRLRLSMSPEFISSQIIRLALNIGTSLVISLLLLLELAKLLSLIASRTLGNLPASEGKNAGRGLSNVVQALRASGFVFFLGYDMGISFIPLLARNLYQPLWGLSEKVLIGLPISAEMISAGVALLISGSFSRRYGWQKMYMLGAVSAAVGLVLGWLAADLPMLIFSRFAAGFGFGMVLMASQIGTLGDERAGAGLGSVFAGIFSGSICGSAAGAMLAEHIGYAAVLLTGAAVTLLAMPVPLLGRTSAAKSRRKTVAPDPLETARTIPDNASGSVFAVFSGSSILLKDPRMYLLLLCVGIPASLCLTGLLQYLLPVLLNAANVEQSDIGRVFMVYGLCCITIGPLLGHWVDKAKDVTLFPLLAGLFSGLSLLVAAMLPSLYGMSASVFVLGLAQSTACPATMLCVLSLSSAQTLGKEKTASIYRALERVGQVAGPVLFGAAIVFMDTTQALLIMGGVICVLAVLFQRVWRISIPKN